MGGSDDFNDRQIHIDAENEPYNQYEYQTEDNGSWAGALPVKQYAVFLYLETNSDANAQPTEDCMIQSWRRMLVVLASPGKRIFCCPRFTTPTN
jgi:hypothetical protein